MIRALVIVLLLALAGDAAASNPPPAAEGIGVDEHVGERIPLDLRFRDAGGEEMRLGDVLLAGRPLLLVLAYANCPMLCSLVLRGVADAVQSMPLRPGDDYALVTVSIDPKDSALTAGRMQGALLAAAHIEEKHRWRFLTGGEPAIRGLADSLGFRYRQDPKTDEYAHPAVVFVLAPDGTISRYLYGLRHDPAELTEALAAARRGATKKSTLVESVLSCFRFDPASRRYGPTIVAAMRVFGIVLLVALTLMIVAALRRRSAR